MSLLGHPQRICLYQYIKKKHKGTIFIVRVLLNVYLKQPHLFESRLCIGEKESRSNLPRVYGTLGGVLGGCGLCCQTFLSSSPATPADAQAGQYPSSTIAYPTARREDLQKAIVPLSQVSSY